MTTQMIETFTFRLKTGVDEAQFHTVAEGLEAYFAAMTGYCSRLVFRTTEGLWRDQILWADAKSMAEGDAAFMSHPAAGAYMALVDEASVTRDATPALFVGQA